MFNFVELSSKLSKNNSKDDMHRCLETFRVQYLNEFLFKVSDRSPDCHSFIKTFTEFFEKKKPQKKDYVELFAKLASYATLTVGGTKDGLPLLANENLDIRTSVSYHRDWYFDQVKAKREELSISSKKCFFCSAKSSKEVCVGMYVCPAECVPICVKCSLPEDCTSIKEYLVEMRPYALSVPDCMKKCLDEFFTVVNELSSGKESVLENVQLSLTKHGEKLVKQHHDMEFRLKKLKRGYSDLEEFNKTVKDDNDEYRITIRNISEDAKQLLQENSKVNARFRDCERAFYEIRERNVYLERQLDYYVDILRRNGLMR